MQKGWLTLDEESLNNRLKFAYHDVLKIMVVIWKGILRKLSSWVAAKRGKEGIPHFGWNSHP